MAGNNTQGYFRGNYYSIVIYRLLITFLFLWLSRVLFLFFNAHHFEHLSSSEVAGLIFYGIRFDFSTLLMLNAPFIVLMTIPLPFRRLKNYRTVAGALFFIPNIAGIVLNMADIVYYRFTQKRMTGDIFEFVTGSVPMDTLAPQFVKDFWPYMLLSLALVLAFVILIRRVGFSKRRFAEGIVSYYQFQTISFLVTLFFMVIGIRGGLQLKPVKIITAAKYTQPRNVPAILNTPFTIIKTIDQQGLSRIRYFDEKVAESIYSPVFVKDEKSFVEKDSARRFNNFNVVVVIMESLSSEHIGYFNQHIGDYQGFTPFLDSLMKHALVYNGFANAKQSIEGIPAIVASLPGLMDRNYINSPFAGNAINSFASLLGGKNYHTSFYHGGTNGTMDFDRFTDVAGFDHYFGRTEYNNDMDFDGRWGIFDEPFFRYFARNLDKTPQPFLSVFFSLSAHHPYTIPQQYEGKFRKGKLTIQEAIMYADFSLKKFFETASKMSWFENTIFVITADHTSEANLPEYQTRVGMFRIPILFFSPTKPLIANPDLTVSQVDILPSVLSLLDFDQTFIAFGNNIFDTATQPFTVNYLNGIYQMIQGDYMLEFDGEKSLALFNFRNDKLLKQNVLTIETDKVQNMELMLKAYIQQYYNRLIENRLTKK